MDFVTIYTTFSDGDAQLVRSRLDAADFHPFVADELSALNSISAGGIRVQVPVAEAEAAKAFLETPPEPAETSE